ncbi:MULTISPECIES: histidine phosphatase family protein [Rhizobium]|uniref:Histidine phosphatase family protein n=1 Tax=Rhizobium bangladeshense TaxID=1138189 RepID=A0ABS7LKE9_9HYPH|nr:MULTISPECIES: histidine phosphatase family protein [Rhizobium]MBX4868880.1 histidine phosphatase family protein [Rhizobium bangladeshense]MBX4873666.1 histidine phosphatase family protein [Rhizobium bangladeshense]MBX4884665.1 histidine phosphatase family protein [Rhizobium bangladeshense]MBX4895626.1 histidine phosphatase family protein [Rhizobium bangladeshense]MBX4904338.1 histidine phosphatase family protein [Rhizobium bangladeshense]
MNTRLTWICHGATAANRKARFPLDEPLEEKAVEEAARVAALPHADRIVTSPALRARQTADALLLEGRIDPSLRDCDHGRWAGRSIQAIESEEPENLMAWMTEPEAAPHGGESLLDLRKRVAGWMEAQSEQGGHVIAVSHAAVIRAAVAHVLQAPPSSFWLTDVEPLAILRMTSNGSRWCLRFQH